MQDSETEKPVTRGPDWTGLLILVLLWTGLVGYFYIFVVLEIFYPPEEFLQDVHYKLLPEDRDALRTRVYIQCYAFILGGFTATIAPALWLIRKYRNRLR